MLDFSSESVKKGIIYCCAIDDSISSDDYIKLCLKRFGDIDDAVIRRDENGKPYVDDISCSFSLSHSASLISFYLSPLPSVGIDIQRTDRKYRESDIAKKAFEKDEIEWMERNSIPFLLLWSMKEAYAKADGRGIFFFHDLGSILPVLSEFRTWEANDGSIDYYISAYPADDCTRLILSDSGFQVRQYMLPGEDSDQ